MEILFAPCPQIPLNQFQEFWVEGSFLKPLSLFCRAVGWHNKLWLLFGSCKCFWHHQHEREFLLHVCACRSARKTSTMLLLTPTNLHAEKIVRLRLAWKSGPKGQIKFSKCREIWKRSSVHWGSALSITKHYLLSYCYILWARFCPLMRHICYTKGPQSPFNELSCHSSS